MMRMPITSTYDVRRIAYDWLDEAEQYLSQSFSESDRALVTSFHTSTAAVDALCGVIAYVMLWEPLNPRDDQLLRRDALGITGVLFSNIEDILSLNLGHVMRPGSDVHAVVESLSEWGASLATGEPGSWLNRYIALAPGDRVYASRAVRFIIDPNERYLAELTATRP